MNAVGTPQCIQQASASPRLIRARDSLIAGVADIAAANASILRCYATPDASWGACSAAEVARSFNSNLNVASTFEMVVSCLSQMFASAVEQVPDCTAPPWLTGCLRRRPSQRHPACERLFSPSCSLTIPQSQVVVGVEERSLIFDHQPDVDGF